VETTGLLDRAAVERVLRRASELAGTDPDDPLELGAIDEQTLVVAAVEAGIPAPAVRRAIAIERLGPVPSAHVGDGLVGPTIVIDEQELPGRAAEVLARIDAWLVAGHHMRRDRLRDDRGEWSKRTGLVGSTMRTIRHATGEGRLGDLQRIAATARDTGNGTCVVRIEADRRRDRTVRVASGVAVGGAATAGVVGVALVTAPLLLLAAPVAIAAGCGIAATGRGRANRVVRELDRVIDAVEQQMQPVRLRTDVYRRVKGGPRRV
jgi:hypothetical protein